MNEHLSSGHYPPGQLLGAKLRVVGLLGEGGMGAVYEVEHVFTHHRRALKLLHGEMAGLPHVVTRFLREASAAGRIGSPHIVETFDAGTLDSGQPYIVMELLRGQSLAQALERNSPYPVEPALAIVRQACEGLQAAHLAGIVHRDVKPDNLFLVEGETPFVKLLDFGISKFDPARTGSLALTQEGSAMGTPFYMPPEQVRGERDLDASADVYALGIVLYECLTGRKPFTAETLPHLCLLIDRGEYQPPSQVRAGLPAAIDELVARAMARDKKDRYPSARAFGEALDELRDPRWAGSIGIANSGAVFGGAQHSPSVVLATEGPNPAEPALSTLTAEGVAAHTHAPLSVTAHVPARRPSKQLLTMGLLVSFGLLAVLAWFANRETHGSAALGQPSSVSPERAAAPPMQAAQAAPVLADDPALAPAPSGSQRVSPSAHPPRPKLDPQPRASSRAKSLGLSEENPF